LLEDQYMMWDAQLEHLQGLRLATDEYAKGLSRGRSSVEDQFQLIQFLKKQDEETREAQRGIRFNRRELERRMAKLEQELDDLISVQPRHRFQAQVNIKVFDEGEFWPELVYVVGNAGWQPLYDIRFIEREESKELEISSIAQVSQQTGQEWKGVQLSVSTARPALNQRLPELNPWYVDEVRPQQPRKARTIASGLEPTMAVMSAPALEPDGIELLDKDFVQADVAVANIHDNETVVRFDVAGTWDVPSDGSPHKMILANFFLDPKINYLAIPKHTDAVYRRATVENSSGGPLLDGEAVIFVADEFIGKTRIEYTPANGELELLLGVEEQIVIKRDLTKRAVDKRLLRENRVLRYAYRIELKNLLQTSVNVEVQDQIPVSKHEQIKVKLERTQPEADKKSELNLFEWHLDLDSGTESVINYEFLIEYPSAMNVGGLRD